MATPQPSRSREQGRVVPWRPRARRRASQEELFFEGELQQQQAQQQQQQQQTRATASEARLARWLERRLRFVAGEAFVRGRAKTVLRALHGGMLYWEPTPLDAASDRAGWRPLGRFHNPAGFLQHLVRQMEAGR